MAKENVSHSWKVQLKDIGGSLLPQNKKELYLLLGIVLFYYSYSAIISIYIPSIIQGPPYLPVDTYFSFDSKLFYHNDVANYTGHPLFKLFITPIIFLGNLCNYILGPSLGKRLFVTFICTIFVSLSIIYIYRYLQVIIKLKGYILNLLTVFFIFFSTNMVLCFTLETYTFSLFTLSFSIYYFSHKIINQNEIDLFSISLLSIIAGGITITNFIKPVIATCFSNDKWSKNIKKILISGCCFLLSIGIVFTVSIHKVDPNALAYYNEYSEIGDNNLQGKYIDMFFGSPILISNMTSVENGVPFPPKIVLEYYGFCWQYLIIGIIFMFVLISIFLSYKNRFVQMLSALFGVDIVIHLIMQFGINDAFIYGGHWIYLIPPLLGWLYTKLPKKALKPYTFTISIICIT